MSDSGQTVRTIVWAIVALFVADLAAVVVVSVVVGDTAAALVASILAALPATAAVVVNLQATGRVLATTETVAQDTHDLRNGLLDAKVRAGVSDVLHPELLDPDYVEGAQADDLRRREGQDGPQDGA